MLSSTHESSNVCTVQLVISWAGGPSLELCCSWTAILFPGRWLKDCHPRDLNLFEGGFVEHPASIYGAQGSFSMLLQHLIWFWLLPHPNNMGATYLKSLSSTNCFNCVFRCWRSALLLSVEWWKFVLPIRMTEVWIRWIVSAGNWNPSSLSNNITRGSQHPVKIAAIC